MMVWKMILLFQGCILRFHVNLLECNTWWKPREYIQLKTERPKVGENQILEKKMFSAEYITKIYLPYLSPKKIVSWCVMCLFTPVLRTCPLFWCFNSQGSTFFTRVFLNAPLSTAQVVWISIQWSLKIRALPKIIYLSLLIRNRKQQ